jgi:hypothetical protein
MILDQPFTQIAHDGNFYIDIRSHLDVYLRYSPWKSGLNVYRRQNNQWEPELRDPDLPLVNEIHVNSPNLPVYHFIKQIPENVRSGILSFNYLQTTMLQLASRSEKARELLVDIPVLLWLVAEKFHLLHWSIEKCDIVLGKNRKSILKAILNTGTTADVKFLKKIKLMHGEQDELNVIKTAIIEAKQEDQLKHWQSIPVQIIALLQRFPNLSQAAFLRLIATKMYDRIADGIADSYRICKLWDDIYHMGSVLNIENLPVVLNHTKTITAMQKIHDRWMERLHRKATIISIGKSFRRPPIPGNEKIFPVLTLEDLLAEGKLMHHCVGGYVNKINNGTSYIYRVLSPERATLEIIGQGRHARIGEFRRLYNQSPSNKTYLSVTQWLENYKNTLPDS